MAEKVKKICKNCKYAAVWEKDKKNLICMKRTDLLKGRVYFTAIDNKCRNYFEPIICDEKEKIGETLEVVYEVKIPAGEMFKEPGSYDEVVTVRGGKIMADKEKIEETLEVASEIKTLVGEVFSKINSYDDAVAVRTALETVLKQLKEENHV